MEATNVIGMSMSPQSMSPQFSRPRSTNSQPSRSQSPQEDWDPEVSLEDYDRTPRVTFLTFVSVTYTVNLIIGFVRSRPTVHVKYSTTSNPRFPIVDNVYANTTNPDSLHETTLLLDPFLVELTFKTLRTTPCVNVKVFRPNPSPDPSTGIPAYQTLHNKLYPTLCY